MSEDARVNSVFARTAKCASNGYHGMTSLARLILSAASSSAASSSAASSSATSRRDYNGAPVACTITVQANYTEYRVRWCLETSRTRVVQRKVSTREKGKVELYLV